MDLSTLKIIYLCKKGGPHAAHEGFLFENAEKVTTRPINLGMLRQAISLRPDLAIADGFGTLPFGWFLKKIRRVNRLVFITTSHAFIYRRHIFRILLKEVDGIVATSSLMRSSVLKIGYDGPVEVCLPIPPISDLLAISPRLDSRGVCFIGNNLRHKGVDLLPKLALSLSSKSSCSRVYVMGPGQKGSTSRKEGIQYLGYGSRARMMQTMSACSVYVHPARIEAFGASVAEAMAAGLIPVVTERTGAKDLVRLVDPDLIVECDVDAISKKIGEIWQWSYEKKARLSKQAKKIVKAQVEVTHSAFIKSIEKMIQ
jgi:glycosyltransferase involved in cell wall biosynthesis